MTEWMGLVKCAWNTLKKNSKVDCINLKSGLFKVEKWTLVHSSKKGGIEWTRFTNG
jgi:hypothetical protein